MANEQMILTNDFCQYHQIEVSFLHSLHEYGLIEITTIEEETFLSPEQVEAIEKMIRLHYDLRINLEGIDAIQHLLQRMETMQSEMTLLRNRLRLYGE
ncbi:MAG: MerR family transcriptional regulator [Chitinophagaceae bacterium]|nr:MAG: MerR family transcriptional regulator [Chitinophagaceae bacterium]